MASPNPSIVYSNHKTKLKFWFCPGIWTPSLWKWLRHLSVWQPKNRSISYQCHTLCFKQQYAQARSQDLEKGGGLFWNIENCANDLDPNFHCSWISFTRFFRKLRPNYSESSEFQRYIPPKISCSPKKKKEEIHRNWDWFFGRNPKFKRSRGGCFPKRGAIFNFSQKIWLKTTKNVQFCILHKPMGELEPPPPPAPPWLRYWVCIIIRVRRVAEKKKAKKASDYQIIRYTLKNSDSTSDWQSLLLFTTTIAIAIDSDQRIAIL